MSLGRFLEGGTRLTYLLPQGGDGVLLGSIQYKQKPHLFTLHL